MAGRIGLAVGQLVIRSSSSAASMSAAASWRACSREVVTIREVDVERPLRRTVPRLYRRELHRRVEPVHRAGAPLQIVGPVALAAVVPVARVLGAVGQR
jgi:hypothetical protein